MHSTRLQNEHSRIGISFGVGAGAVLLLALAVRLLCLNQQNFWFDEMLTQLVSAKPWSELTTTLQQAENTKPPLYFAFVHEWLRFGTSEWWLRLPSALFGAAACGVAIAIARRLFNGKSAWQLGLFLALSPMHVWYSQEARMYALLCLLASVAILFNLRFLERPNWKDLVGYTVFAILTSYTFTYGVFLLGFSGLLSLLYRPRIAWSKLAQLAAANVLAFVAFIPWALVIRGSVSEGKGLQFHQIKGTIAEALGYTFYSLGFGTTFGPSSDSLRTYLGGIFRAEPVNGALLILGLALLSVLTAWGLWELWNRKRNAFWFAAFGLLIFWIGPALVSILKPGVTYNPRYAILALLPLMVALMGVLEAETKRMERGILLGAFALCVTWSLWNHFTDSRYWKDDLRSPALYANQLKPVPERIVICAGYLNPPFSHYYTGKATTTELTLTTPDSQAQLAQLRQELAGTHSWIFVYARPQHGDPQHLIPEWLTRNFQVVERRKWTGTEAIRLEPLTATQ